MPLRLQVFLLVLLVSGSPGRAEAMKTIVLDWEIGRVTEAETEETLRPPAEEKNACAEESAARRRLEQLAVQQEKEILRLRRTNAALKQKIREQEEVIRGLDQLRRGGR